MSGRHLAVLIALTVSGCAVDVRDIGREPHMTPVGAGLHPPSVPIASEPTRRPVYRGGNSLWQDASSDLFSDPRATRVGDVVTVKIIIKDKASLDNSSNRSRDAKKDLSLGLNYGLNIAGVAPRVTASGDGSLDTTVDSKTETKSQGGVNRSESINLLVAAVVTDVMPNGNLMISGTQEVRVNFDVRVLTVAGVVRPRDISTENTVSYEKIAEARISYGGRGRTIEVQQPAYGQQILDQVIPF
ncbi:MAG: flagellar basal body L-ring protein FlgH [Hyphomicrobiales bacterium]|nr:flagellar basal body L-ring protein FlgH [Hyphomicrobiales bacterium]